MRRVLVLLSVCLLLVCFASAQTGSPASSCGPSNVNFNVKTDNAQHSLTQPEPGKALVYVIEVFQRPPGELGTPTIRVGLNGTWVGANRGGSYFSFSVDPGEQHLCTNWQSVWKRLSDQHSLTSFIAEAGKTYFFQVRVHVESEGRESQIWYIELQPINVDEGRYLVASSPLSVFQAKK